MIALLTYLRFATACLSQHLNYRAADGWVNPNPAFPPCDQAQVRYRLAHVTGCSLALAGPSRPLACRYPDVCIET